MRRPDFAFAAVLFMFETVPEVIQHIKFLRFANDNVIAAAVDGVAGLNRHHTLTRITPHRQTADDAGAHQITIVKFVLLDDVTLRRIQVFVGQQLAAKETRPLKTLLSATRRAGLRLTDGCRPGSMSFGRSHLATSSNARLIRS